MSASDANLGDFSMVDLFRAEAESTLATLTAGLLALEGGAAPSAVTFEELMRAAHSLKGAARIVGINAAVRVAHAMEDRFVAAQHGQLVLDRTDVDRLLTGVDLLARIAKTSEAEMGKWEHADAAQIETFLASLMAPRSETTAGTGAGPLALEMAAGLGAPDTVAGGETRPPMPATGAKGETRSLRVDAENLNRLLALAGESLVESRWLRPYGETLGRLKRMHRELGAVLDQLRSHAGPLGADERFREIFADAQQRLAGCRNFVTARLLELETFERRATSLSDRLYAEAVAVRMRPFVDAAGGFPRMVRDVARQLGKEVRYELVGEDTPVDREILAKLEAPLGHLLRNAVDHGLEAPAVRQAAGKPAAGLVRIEARHQAGLLMITVSDDGRGASAEDIRTAVLARKLVDAATAAKLTEAELLEFLFLPGFSLKGEVTEISGRGVGLDVVQTMVRAVRGTIRVHSTRGAGMRFQLQLPLTLSVVRALLFEVDGEPYALPLGYIVRALRLAPERIEATQGRPHFELEGRRVGLIAARQLLGRAGAAPQAEPAVIVLGEDDRRYGLVVDRFLGERELVVQPLDPRLGKVRDVAAGAFMEDGAPVLILDVDDLAHSADRLAATGRLLGTPGRAAPAVAARKRVLVIDDSLTVRELERKLLESHGYAVETAVDGVEGFNAARQGAFDLIVTDVDMPRRDGIELTRLLKADARLKSLPVMIVSYKDREEDRMRGLEAGADYYLTKGSFQDDTMLQAVADLIGPAQSAPANP
jgi:two-component system, chemotaxis family, sensor histidine kinase and response regulator WspE